MQPELLAKAIGAHQAGDLPTAEQLYKAVLQNEPSNCQALGLLGAILVERGQVDDGVRLLKRSLTLDPNQPGALTNLGNALRRQRKLDAALGCITKSIAMKPNNPAAHLARGVLLNDMHRYEAALSSFDLALSLEPNMAAAFNARGATLWQLRRIEEALLNFDRAIKLDPKLAKAYFNKSLVKLTLGQYEEGWALYEWRSKEPVSAQIASIPTWTGKEPLHGRTILVTSEQGLGDIIQFCRYLTGLASQGAEVNFLVSSKMHRILKPLAPAIRLIEQPPEGKSFDFQVALLSLPAAFETTIDTIPAVSPYLHAERLLVERWRKQIGSGGFRIGICWHGNPNRNHSFPLRHFYPIACISSVRLISLQKYNGLDQLADLPAGMRVETLSGGFDNGPDAFIDTAAVMSSLDLIITSDTSVAHLAGALGRAVWVILSDVPDWRWMLDRNDSPWYPSMRLFRQSCPNSWSEAFDQVASAIKDILSWKKKLP